LMKIQVKTMRTICEAPPGSLPVTELTIAMMNLDPEVSFLHLRRGHCYLLSKSHTRCSDQE
jgi:hypothetical protein